MKLWLQRAARTRVFRLTRVAGVFAIGDARSALVKRIGVAFGERSAMVAQIHAFMAQQGSSK
jgi:thioredoxin reductase (NADPH)